jgi:WD40 repeat protein
LRLWDVQTGKAINSPFNGHKSGVIAVAFSPDGRRIVSGSQDSTLRLWDVQTGKAINSPFNGHKSGVIAVAFSPDGRRIVSGSYDKTVRLWNAQTGQSVGQPLLRDAQIRSVAFSPDGRRIASGSYDRTVQIWDSKTGQPIGQPLFDLEDIGKSQDSNVISSVAFSPDGSHIVSGGWDKTIHVWDVSSEGWLKIACDRLQYHPLLNHPETVTSDPEMLKVSRRSKDVCQRRVWHQQPTPAKSPIDWLKQSYQWVTDRFF